MQNTLRAGTPLHNEGKLFNAITRWVNNMDFCVGRQRGGRGEMRQKRKADGVLFAYRGVVNIP